MKSDITIVEWKEELENLKEHLDIADSHHMGSEWVGSGSNAVWRSKSHGCSVVEGRLSRLR